MSEESPRRAAEQAAVAAEKAAAAAQDAAEAARKAAGKPGEPDEAGSDAVPRPEEGAQDPTPFAPARGTDRTNELGMGEGGL